MSPGTGASTAGRRMRRSAPDPALRASLPRAPERAPAKVSTATICAVVPAFNEAAVVGEVVRAISRALPAALVVVVDDSSTDDTAAQAADAGAVVIRLPVNLGIGGAVQAGYRYALRAGCAVAVRADGDGQHDASELTRLMEPLLDGRADMTVGSRWLGRGDYAAPSGRRIGMHLLSWMVRMQTGTTYTDTTSGFSAVGPKALQLFARTYPVDFPEAEALVLAARHGLVVEEVPVRMQHRQHGRSSIAGLRSAYYIARVVLSLLVDSFQRSDRPQGKETG